MPVSFRANPEATRDSSRLVYGRQADSRNPGPDGFVNIFGGGVIPKCPQHFKTARRCRVERYPACRRFKSRSSDIFRPNPPKTRQVKDDDTVGLSENTTLTKRKSQLASRWPFLDGTRAVPFFHPFQSLLVDISSWIQPGKQAWQVSSGGLGDSSRTLATRSGRS